MTSDVCCGTLRLRAIHSVDNLVSRLESVTGNSPISFIKAWQAIRACRALMVFGSQLGRWGRVGG